MAVNFGTPIVSSGLVTKAGTTLISALGTGFKIPVAFSSGLNVTTNLTTFMSPFGGPVALFAASAKKAYIPWTGSVVGVGVRGSGAITTGKVTFVPFNGSTTLSGTVTLNTTVSTAVNGSLIALNSKIFTTNNLKLQMKSSTDLAPTTLEFSAVLWCEV